MESMQVADKVRGRFLKLVHSIILTSTTENHRNLQRANTSLFKIISI